MGNAKVILQPARDYYNILFHKEGEDVYDTIRRACAAIFQSSTFEGDMRRWNCHCSSIWDQQNSVFKISSFHSLIYTLVEEWIS